MSFCLFTKHIIDCNFRLAVCRMRKHRLVVHVACGVYFRILVDVLIRHNCAALHEYADVFQSDSLRIRFSANADQRLIALRFLGFTGLFVNDSAVFDLVTLQPILKVMPLSS